MKALAKVLKVAVYVRFVSNPLAVGWGPWTAIATLLQGSDWVRALGATHGSGAIRAAQSSITDFGGGMGIHPAAWVAEFAGVAPWDDNRCHIVHALDRAEAEWGSPMVRPC